MATFEQLRASDGTWAAVRENWADQCVKMGEDPATFAEVTLDELSKLAEQNNPSAGVFGLRMAGDYDVVCQANCTPLPGYEGRVLRVRFITLSPYWDLQDQPIEKYGDLLIDLFFEVLSLSNTQYDAPHLKFHLRSPADRSFFAALGRQLGKHRLFRAIETRGAWMYISK